MLAGLRALIQKLCVILLALLLSLSIAACSQSNDQLKIITQTGPVAFSVELVDTPELRSKGLMFRQDLPENTGMIFDFLEEREVSFWMKNTFIPLDLIFIDATGRIVNIHENARPHDETGIPSGQPVQFVFEIGGGQSDLLGIQVGDQIEYRDLK